MRLLVLNRAMGIGGGATFTIELARMMRSHGHWVGISAAGGELSQETKEAANAFSATPLVSSFQRPLLRSYLKRNAIDVVNAHSYTQARVAMPVCRSLGLPVAITMHGPHNPKKLEQWKPLFEQAHAVMVMNEQVARFYWLAGVPKEKIFLTRLFLPWHSSGREYGPACVFGICSRLSGLKGPMALAWMKAVAQMPGIKDKRVVVFGDGGYRQQLWACAKENALSVEMKGSVPNASAQFSGVDVLAGGGYVALEGLRAGCAVVGLGFDGCMGAVTAENLDAAIAVNFGDHALRKLETDPALIASSLSQAAHVFETGEVRRVSKLAGERCSPEAVGPRIVGFFEALAAGNEFREFSLPFDPEVDMAEELKKSPRQAED